MTMNSMTQKNTQFIIHNLLKIKQITQSLKLILNKLQMFSNNLQSQINLHNKSNKKMILMMIMMMT